MSCYLRCVCQPDPSWILRLHHPARPQTRRKGTDRGPPQTQTHPGPSADPTRRTEPHPAQQPPTPTKDTPPQKNTPTPKTPHKPDRTNRQKQSRGDQALQAHARLSLNPDALVETIAKGQTHQATGKGHMIHALVEIPSKGQALQAAGQIIFAMF